jgi:hypothetical protein
LESNVLTGGSLFGVQPSKEPRATARIHGLTTHLGQKLGSGGR